METNIKKLIGNISGKSTRKIVEDHIKELNINTENKSIIIILDKKFALHQLSSNEHIWDLLKWVKKSFWEEYETILKSNPHITRGEKDEHHDREMNVPHTIHYN